MKKILLLSLALLLPASLFAATMPYSLGAGMGLSGEALDGEGNTSVSLSLYYTPFATLSLNPSLRVETDYTWDNHTFGFDAFRATVVLDIVREINNPTQKYFNNTRAWCPSVELGIETNKNNKICGYLCLAPLKSMDKDYIYEVFCPFITFTNKIETWGLIMLKLTPLYL